MTELYDEMDVMPSPKSNQPIDISIQEVTEHINRLQAALTDAQIDGDTVEQDALSSEIDHYNNQLDILLQQ